MKLRWNDKRTYLSLVISLLIFDTALSFVGKYSINGLGIGDFKPLFIGNVLIFMIFFASVIGIFLKIIINNSSSKIKSYCLSLVVLSLVLNFASAILNKWQIFGAEEYLLEFPANKLLVSIIILSKTFVQLYFISFVWMAVFRSDSWNILRAFIVTIILLLSMNLFSFLFIGKDVSGSIENGNKNKTAVVLGAAVYKNNQPSPLFEARIKKAYELFQSSKVNKILVTGSNAPGEITEAEAAFKYLKGMGVAENRIIVEKDSRTTIDQIRYLKQSYISEHENEQLVVVSDKFHLARTSEICEFMGVDFKNTASDYVVGDEKLLFYKTRESISLLVFWLFGI